MYVILMLKVYLITVVFILSPVSYCRIPPPKLLIPVLPVSDRLLSVWCACCLLVRVGEPVQQNCPSFSGFWRWSLFSVLQDCCKQLLAFRWSRFWFHFSSGKGRQHCQCCRTRAVGECGSNNLLECGMMPSPGAMALTGQPKAYTAEDKLQGKREIARGKEKWEQREGDEVMEICRSREEGAAVKAASREEGVTFHTSTLPTTWSTPGPSLGTHMAPGTWRWKCGIHFTVGSIVVWLQSFPLPRCLHRVTATNCPWGHWRCASDYSSKPFSDSAMTRPCS